MESSPDRLIHLPQTIQKKEKGVPNIHNPGIRRLGWHRPSWPNLWSFSALQGSSQRRPAPQMDQTAGSCWTVELNGWHPKIENPPLKPVLNLCLFTLGHLIGGILYYWVARLDA